MFKNLICYVALFLIFGTGAYITLGVGARLKHADADTAVKAESSSAVTVSRGAPDSAPSAAPARVSERDPLSTLLIQVLAVIAAARLCGGLFRKIGQPAVVGEMAAGLILGPSVLGALAPSAQSFLFPTQSLGFLKLLSQFGVILFMFTVGVELNLRQLRQRAHAAVLVSHASILVPFFLGITFSLLIYPAMAPAGISFSAFALFIGVAMSITAFPVLARIVEERGLRETYLGSTVIACAAVDDVTAWCILAFVVALVQAKGFGGGLLTVSLALLFTTAMLFVVRPRVVRAAARRAGALTSGEGGAALALCFVFASALVTELIGIHALFGAFLAGVVVSTDAGVRVFVRERLGTFVSTLLLPLFFAFTGLRTQLGLLTDPHDWAVCAGLIATAVVGKLGAGMLAARWTGMSWRDSFSVGALMNTRGLIELIVLNLGYDLGVLSPKVFTMMVIVALTTTFMTGPLLSLAEALGRKGTVGATGRLSPHEIGGARSDG